MPCSIIARIQQCQMSQVDHVNISRENIWHNYVIFLSTLHNYIYNLTQCRTFLWWNTYTMNKMSSEE